MPLVLVIDNVTKLTPLQLLESKQYCAVTDPVPAFDAFVAVLFP